MALGTSISTFALHDEQGRVLCNGRRAFLYFEHSVIKRKKTAEVCCAFISLSMQPASSQAKTSSTLPQYFTGSLCLGVLTELFQLLL